MSTEPHGAARATGSQGQKGLSSVTPPAASLQPPTWPPLRGWAPSPSGELADGRASVRGSLFLSQQTHVTVGSASTLLAAGDNWTEPPSQCPWHIEAAGTC